MLSIVSVSLVSYFCCRSRYNNNNSNNNKKDQGIATTTAASTIKRTKGNNNNTITTERNKHTTIDNKSTKLTNSIECTANIGNMDLTLTLTNIQQFINSFIEEGPTSMTFIYFFIIPCKVH